MPRSFWFQGVWFLPHVCSHCCRDLKRSKYVTVTAFQDLIMEFLALSQGWFPVCQHLGCFLIVVIWKG